jgi:hypothetical protein
MMSQSTPNHRDMSYAPENLKLLIHVPHTHSTCRRTLHPPLLHVHSLCLPLVPCVLASRLRPHALLCSGGTHSAPMEQTKRWAAREARTARGDRWRGRGMFLFCNLNWRVHIGNCQLCGGFWTFSRAQQD